jgi:putative transposase
MAAVESFNGRRRRECAKSTHFRTLDNARTVIEAWRRDYNQVRPRSSLGPLTPQEYQEICQGQAIAEVTFPPKSTAVPNWS